MSAKIAMSPYWFTLPWPPVSWYGVELIVRVPVVFCIMSQLSVFL